MKCSPQATVALSGVLCLIVPASGAPQTGAQRLPPLNGHIVYRMIATGPTSASNTVSMTWTDYGKRFRQDTQMRILNAGPREKPVTVKMWTICDGHSLFTVMPAAPRFAWRAKLTPNFNRNRMLGGGLGMPGLSAEGGKMVGRATLLGKPCVIRATTDTTSYGTIPTKKRMWQNLLLRTEMTIHYKRSNPPIPMKITIVATKLDTSLRPAAATFRLPAGFTIRDLGAAGNRARPRVRTGR